jgi:ABC-type transport system substrate-binding protein
MKMELTRRNLLGIGGAGLATATLSSCGWLSTDPTPKTAETRAAGAKGSEAPQLAELVKSGGLPPVAERLPEEPLVVQPTAAVGVYGGTWKTMIDGPEDVSWLDRTAGYEPLVRWNPDFTEIIANVAASYESNAEGTEYTFKLRTGMKWSDGEPFTVEDLMFTRNEVDNHAILGNGTDDVVVEKVADDTAKYILKEPNALFLQEWAANSVDLMPKHYLKQFHPDYEDKIAELNEPEISDTFETKAAAWENPDLPSIYPWVLAEELSGGKMTLERNPYYWKTDPEGSQLPYIDKIEYSLVANPEVMVLRIADGEVDMHVRHVNTPVNKPVLAKAAEEGGYEFFDAVPANMNTMVIGLNFCVQNKNLEEVFNNLDFRIGLSHAINREEIITGVYQRTGKPWQAAPRPESQLYHEKLATQYTEYNVETANQHLDQAGYTERDSNGFRLGPNGKKISFPISVKAEEANMVAALEIVRNNWKEVGIEMRVDVLDSTLKFEREVANKHVASTHTGDGGMNDAYLDPRWYLPMQPFESKFALPWAMWYDTNGEEGTEPPDTEAGRHAKAQFDLYDQIKSTTDPAQQQSLMMQLLDISAEAFWAIGLSLPDGGYGIVGNDFHNVPESMVDAWIYPTPGPTNPEQYYKDAE